MLAKALQKGDTIGIIAPSRAFDPEKRSELDDFINYMSELGIHVKLSKNFYKKDKYGVSGGTPKERADDINSMFTDKDINAIWCLQGGDTANQTLDLIDYDLASKNPKLFIGKSDIDVLLLALNKKAGLITIHSCDPKIGRNREMDFDYTKEWFRKRLFEGSKKIEPTEEWTCMNKGECEGRIIGCNSSSILKLAGTDYFPDFTDAILFIEVYKMNPATLIHKLTQMKQTGIFDKIKGIVVGNNFGFEGDGFTVEGIMKDLTEQYDLPILKINEFGHYQPHAFLPIGARARVDATNKTIEILDDFLEL